MLIVSKFRDFYDSVAYQKGVDKTLVYKRELKELKFDPDDRLKNHKMLYSYGRDKAFPSFNSNNYSSWMRRSAGDFKLETFIIGFCGKIYPVCKRTDVIKNETGIEDVVSYIYTYDKILEQFETVYKGKNDDWWKSRLSEELSYFKTYCERNDVKELFYQYKSPIFTIDNLIDNIRDNKNLILNPCLKDFEFYKCMDTYQVFQELEMYIGGVLGSNGKDTVEVSDESKIVGKGFDLKTSFRKEPGTKKRGKNK